MKPQKRHYADVFYSLKKHRHVRTQAITYGPEIDGLRALAILGVVLFQVDLNKCPAALQVLMSSSSSQATLIETKF